MGGRPLCLGGSLDKPGFDVKSSTCDGATHLLIQSRPRHGVSKLLQRWGFALAPVHGLEDRAPTVPQEVYVHVPSPVEDFRAAGSDSLSTGLHNRQYGNKEE